MKDAVAPIAEKLKPRLVTAADRYKETTAEAYSEFMKARLELRRLLHELNKSTMEIAGLELNSYTSIGEMPYHLMPGYAYGSIQRWPDL